MPALPTSSSTSVVSERDEPKSSHSPPPRSTAPNMPVETSPETLHRRINADRISDSDGEVSDDDDASFSYRKYDLDELRTRCNNTHYLAIKVKTRLAGTEQLSLNLKYLSILDYDRKSCLRLNKASWTARSC
ncbi:hypothetical protein H2200_009997 [Cladophialophora chaetospira]|uniref:Uncharacterized protein n=1 Tax=Cladophialophora chaetospira TaxID=386627 RepID=A0AA38X212_9EURO|nr:hypothetical protein H2200_009997 [Cladophialophora chaetospira]